MHLRSQLRLVTLAATAVVAASCAGGAYEDGEWVRERQGLTRYLWRYPTVNSGFPPARYKHRMVWADHLGKVVLFGGQKDESADADFFDDVWLWDPIDETWTEVTTTPRPGPRSMHAMAYDPDRQRVIVYGGFSLSQRYDDTWAFDGTSWTQLTPTGTDPPPSLRAAAAAYDRKRNRTVIHGGIDSSNVDHEDVWELDWSADPPAWVHASTNSGTGKRFNHAAVWDPSRQQVMIAGGRLSTIDYDDVWLWDGTLMNPLTTTGTPGQRNRHAMAWDPVRDILVLFGGGPGISGTEQVHYELDSAVWTARTPEGVVPSARADHAMAAVPDGRILLFSGRFGTSKSPYADTYVYELRVTSDDAGTGGGTVDAGGSGGGAGGGGGGGAGGAGGGTVTDGGSGGSGGDTADAGPPPWKGARYGCSQAGGEAFAGAVVLLALAWALRRRRGWLGLFVLLAASQATPARAEPVRLAFLGVAPSTGIHPADAESISDFVQSELAAIGVYQVMSMNEVRNILGLEAERQMIGCGDDARCTAELAGALAAPRTLAGSVARVGDTLILNLTLMDPLEARTIARGARRVRDWRKNLEPLLDEVEPLLRELVNQDPLVSDDAPQSGPSQPPPSLAVGLRGDVLANPPAGSSGAAVGIHAAWRHSWFGLAGEFLAWPPGGLRAVFRVHPVALGPVVPYLGAGATLFYDSVSSRLTLGVEVDLGPARLHLDGAYETTLTGRYDRHSVLVGGGLAWSFGGESTPPPTAKP